MVDNTKENIKSSFLEIFSSLKKQKWSWAIK